MTKRKKDKTWEFQQALKFPRFSFSQLRSKRGVFTYHYISTSSSLPMVSQ